MRRRITLRNSGTAWRDGYKSNRHRSADKLQSSFHHRMPFGEIIDGVDRRYERNHGSSGQRRNTRCRRRNLASGGLPDPAIWLPKPRTELRYRHCDIYRRIDVAVFSRSFAGVPYPVTARLTLTAPRYTPRRFSRPAVAGSLLCLPMRAVAWPAPISFSDRQQVRAAAR